MPETSADRTDAGASDSRKTVPVPFIALTLAVIAIAIAAAAWFRAGHGGPRFNDSQVAQAKTNVCAAYVTVRKGVVENTHMVTPNRDDRTSQLAVAANARLALLGGGGYLRDRLATEPATPADLAKAASSMSQTIEQLGANYLAAADNSLQDPLRKDLDGEIKQLNDICK